MRTRRRTYTAATPPIVAVSGTKRRKLQSCTAKTRGSKKNKCNNNIGGLWALLPLDLLLEILSRLGLKAKIQASAVCKSWFEAAVPVRKLQPSPPPPLLFHSQLVNPPWHIPPDPLRFTPCKLEFPGFRYNHNISCSKDGWVISTQTYTVTTNTLLLNPFTRETFYLPPRLHNFYLTIPKLSFSAAPTSPSCMVITYFQLRLSASVEIITWRPGETVWTTHLFENQLPSRSWKKCVFSNGMFYCLSSCGYLGVFDPSKATWSILPVKPCPSFTCDPANPVFMTEHEGDIFVIYIFYNNKNPTVFKLDSKRNEWEEKRDLGGLTIFISLAATFVRAGLSTEHRNRIYCSFLDMLGRYGMYYSLGDPKSSDPPKAHQARHHLVWVEPPTSQQR